MRNVVSLQGLLLCPFVFQPFYTQVFHKTLPSGKEANLPVVTTVSYEQRCLACFYTPKKQQKTWNPTRATSISKIMLLDTFLWVPYEISWGYIQELNKTLPFKYVWISRASYIFIWFKLYSKFACFWWSTVDQMVDIRVSARHLRWSCSCRSESTKALLAQFAKAGGSTRLKGDDHMIYI
jgi:hypothetical protein